MNGRTMNSEFQSKKVAAAFERVSPAIRKKLFVLRKLIFDVASKTTGVGTIEETLKWDSPSYITSESQSGTTIRIDHIAAQEGKPASAEATAGKYGIFVHCQSNVVKQFKQKSGTDLEFDSTRGIVLDVRNDIPKEVSYFIYLALTYHLRKKKRSVKDLRDWDLVC